MLQIDELQREVDKTLALLEKEREVSKPLLNRLTCSFTRAVRKRKDVYPVTVHLQFILLSLFFYVLFLFQSKSVPEGWACWVSEILDTSLFDSCCALVPLIVLKAQRVMHSVLSIK